MVSNMAKTEIPSDAQAVFRWHLDAWESQLHPDMLGGFELVRAPIDPWDGWIRPTSADDKKRLVATVYIVGWLGGFDAGRAR